MCRTLAAALDWCAPLYACCLHAPLLTQRVRHRLVLNVPEERLPRRFSAAAGEPISIVRLVTSTAGAAGASAGSATDLAALEEGAADDEDGDEEVEDASEAPELIMPPPA